MDSLSARKFFVSKFVFVAAVISVLMFSGIAANAGFLDDLFGGPDPAPQIASPRRSERKSAVRPHARAPQEETRLKTKIQFLAVPAVKEKRLTRENIRVKNAERPLATAVKPAVSPVAGAKPVTASLCVPETSVNGVPASSLLAYDRTLRHGDIMVTDSGVQVFKGHAACPHDARDFLSVSSVNMTRSRRRMLLAIEEVIRRPREYVHAMQAD